MCFIRYPNTEKLRLKKRGAAKFLNNFNLGVWISDETHVHFQVFNMASQMINNSWRNSSWLKLAKFYGN